MAKNIISRKNFYRILLFLISLSFVGESYANLPGRWVYHPAAALRSKNKESQIDRIIDANNCIYFSVRGAWMNRSQTLTTATAENIDPLQLFYYDKSTPWQEGCVKPLANKYQLSGILPVVLNYSHDHGTLAVIYENNSIDFIKDNGTVVSSTALYDKLNLGAAIIPYSITFDNDLNQAYIGCNLGYITVDIDNGDFIGLQRLPRSVAWAGRIGDNMVVFAGEFDPQSYTTATYILPYNEKVAELPDSITGADNLQALMPVSATSFAALEPGSSDTQNILKLYTINDGTLTSEILENAASVDNGAHANFRHLFRTDGYVQSVKNGFAVHNSNNVVLVPKVREGKPEVRKISKSALTATEKMSKATISGDDTLWLYTYDSAGDDESVRGFYTKKFAGSAWETPSSIVTPVGPTNLFAAYCDWNDTYGLLLRGPGARFQYNEQGYDYFCSLNNGEWVDRSFTAKSQKYKVPTLRSMYVDTDIIGDNYVWASSNSWGLYLVDLVNPGFIFVIGLDNKKGDETTYPGYHAVLPEDIGFKSLVQTSNVAFDNNGTMWFDRLVWGVFPTDSEKFNGSYIPLYYLTQEERQKIINGEDPQAILAEMLKRELRIPQASTFYWQEFLALKSSVNKNFLAATHREFDSGMRRSFIYDTNGTPDVADDDRFIYLHDMIDEDGHTILYSRERSLYEDPVTGELWFTTDGGVFILQPSEAIEDLKCRRPSLKSTFQGDNEGNLFESIAIWQIDDDIYGRKWMATDEGLYCLTSEGTELLGHYTTSNSGIQSDKLYNLVCSPSGSIFILSDRGISEFQPEGSAGFIAEGNHLSIFPTSITPSYNGYVQIYGAEDSSEYEVTDSEGNTVKALGHPTDSSLQWDCKDSQGNKVNPGRYNIRRVGYEENHPFIVLAK